MCLNTYFLLTQTENHISNKRLFYIKITYLSNRHHSLVLFLFLALTDIVNVWYVHPSTQVEVSSKWIHNMCMPSSECGEKHTFSTAKSIIIILLVVIIYVIVYQLQCAIRKSWDRDLQITIASWPRFIRLLCNMSVVCVNTCRKLPIPNCRYV